MKCEGNVLLISVLCAAFVVVGFSSAGFVFDNVYGVISDSSEVEQIIAVVDDCAISFCLNDAVSQTLVSVINFNNLGNIDVGSDIQNSAAVEQEILQENVCALAI